MSNEQSLALAIGTLMPVIIAIVVQSKWSARAKELVAFGSCFLAAAATVYMTGGLALRPRSAAEFGTDLLLILVATGAAYTKFWKPTGIAPFIEQLTNLSTVLAAIPRVSVSVSRPAAAPDPAPEPAPAPSASPIGPVPSMAPVEHT